MASIHQIIWSPFSANPCCNVSSANNGGSEFCAGTRVLSDGPPRSAHQNPRPAVQKSPLPQPAIPLAPITGDQERPQCCREQPRHPRSQQMVSEQLRGWRRAAAKKLSLPCTLQTARVHAAMSRMEEALRQEMPLREHGQGRGQVPLGGIRAVPKLRWELRGLLGHSAAESRVNGRLQAPDFVCNCRCCLFGWMSRELVNRHSKLIITVWRLMAFQGLWGRGCFF